MSTRASKHFSDGRQDGWKKTVAGREWLLGYGVSAEDEARAKRLAGGLEAKWQLARLSGATELTQADFDEVKDLIARRQTSTGSVPGASAGSTLSVANVAGLASPTALGRRRWLFERKAVS